MNTLELFQIPLYYWLSQAIQNTEVWCHSGTIVFSDSLFVLSFIIKKPVL